MREWRIPAIFAAPVLLWAAVVYLAIQPLPSSADPLSIGGGVLAQPSPTPWKLILPSVPIATPAPATYVPSVTPPCSKNVIAMQATVGMASGILTIKVVDQGHHPVTCAWVMPVSGGGLEGATGADGTLSVALADMPAHFHSVSQAVLGNANTAFVYGR